MQIPKSFTVDEKLYPKFKEECEKRSISVSKWIRNKMIEQVEIWKEQ